LWTDVLSKKLKKKSGTVPENPEYKPPGKIKEYFLQKKCFLVHFQCKNIYPNFPNTSPLVKIRNFFVTRGACIRVIQMLCFPLFTSRGLKKCEILSFIGHASQVKKFSNCKK
jgi:hypothetical protein